MGRQRKRFQNFSGSILTNSCRSASDLNPNSKCFCTALWLCLVRYLSYKCLGVYTPSSKIERGPRFLWHFRGHLNNWEHFVNKSGTNHQRMPVK